MDIFIVLSPILLVLMVAVYFYLALKRREKRRTLEAILDSGNQGELKVQEVLKTLERSKRYKVFHNIKLGPDMNNTNEYDSVIVGPNGIFHIETKNYGGERGGIIDIDSSGNWILHKKNGHSKMVNNPAGQIDSHEYRLKGFLRKVVGVKNLPTQGVIVLSCDKVKLTKKNRKEQNAVPVMGRKELVKYIKSYNQGQRVLYTNTIKKICYCIEAMNNRQPAVN